MKRFVVIIILMGFSFNLLLAESPSDKLRMLLKSKDYELAAAAIPEAIKDRPKDIDILLMAGDVYFELEKLDSALIFYRKAFDMKETPQALRKLGKTLSLKGNHSEAVKLLRDAVDKEPKDAYMLLELGNAYIKADSIRQAELVITKARELNKQIPDAYIALGDLYFAQKVYELARSNYEEALSIDDKLIEARIKLATAYYWLANRETDKELSNELFTRSLKEWDRIAKEDPKNFKAFFQCGKILFLARRYGDAASYLNRYIQLKPDGSIGRWLLAQSLFEISKCDSAIPHLMLCIQQIDTVKDKARLKLAQCNFEQKKFKESIEIYSQLKATSKLDPVDMERFAAASYRIGDTTGAIKLYKELVDMDPTKCDLMFQLGSLTLFMKKFEESYYFFNANYQHCKDTARSAKVLYYLGYNLYYMNKPDSALPYIKKSISLDTNYLTAKVFLGDIFVGLKQTDTAQVIFMNVIQKGLQDTAKSRKELIGAFSKISSILLEEKSYPKLLKVTKQWTEYDSKYELAWIYNAIAYQGQQEVENACRSWKKVLQINAKNEIAKKNVKALNCP